MAKRMKRGERKPPRSLGKRRPRSPTGEAPTPRVTAPAVVTVEDRPEADVVIVGVGASAGGLEAFSQLLQALPRDPGFGMVLVQHLAPQHESALPTLLSGKTNMPVVQAKEGMLVEPNHV